MLKLVFPALIVVAGVLGGYFYAHDRSLWAFAPAIIVLVLSVALGAWRKGGRDL